MTVEFETLTLPAPSEVKIEVSLTTQVNMTDFTAQRKVSKLLLDQVGNLLYGEHPTLVAGRRLLWRVPVWVGLSTIGPVGQIGVVDVDAQTGEVLVTLDILRDLGDRAHDLVERTTSQAVSYLIGKPTHRMQLYWSA